MSPRQSLHIADKIWPSGSKVSFRQRDTTFKLQFIFLPFCRWKFLWQEEKYLSDISAHLCWLRQVSRSLLFLSLLSKWWMWCCCWGGKTWSFPFIPPVHTGTSKFFSSPRSPQVQVARTGGISSTAVLKRAQRGTKSYREWSSGGKVEILTGPLSLMFVSQGRFCYCLGEAAEQERIPPLERTVGPRLPP